MIVCRLIDQEGVTWHEMSLPDDPNRPRLHVKAPVPQPLSFAGPDFDPMQPVASLKVAEFKLERRTGDGIYIYRMEQI